jgi:hypothetical protein
MTAWKHPPTIQPTETDKAYAAGFLDGEGTFTIRRRAGAQAKRGNGEWYFCSVVCSQVVPTPLWWLAERWGGGVYGHPETQPNARPSFRWEVANQAAYSICRDVLPFLWVKKDACANILRFSEIRVAHRFAGRTDEELELQRACRKLSLRLNSKGLVT